MSREKQATDKHCKRWSTSENYFVYLVELEECFVLWVSSAKSDVAFKQVLLPTRPMKYRNRWKVSVSWKSEVYHLPSGQCQVPSLLANSTEIGTAWSGSPTIAAVLIVPSDSHLFRFWHKLTSSPWDPVKTLRPFHHAESCHVLGKENHETDTKIAKGSRTKQHIRCSHFF